MYFINHHLSATAKTMVRSVKDFDKKDSKPIEVYGQPWAIVNCMLIETDENITQ